MSRDLLEFAEDTAPTEAGAERVLARVMESEPEAVSCGALIREIPAGDPEAVERVLARVAARERRRRPAALWMPGLALAAAALLVGVWATWAPGEPAAVEVAVVEAPPATLALTLDSEEPAVVQVARGVSVEFTGTAEVAGTEAVPVIHLSRGHMRVSVDPAAGVALEVRTEEGSARVLGTIFTVDRDVLGTHVGVERGRVAVGCADSADLELTAEMSQSCLPATAAGMTSRTRRLLESGAALAEIRDNVDRGQRFAAEADFDWLELEALRLQALLGAGEAAAACAIAGGWPAAEGDLRAAEVSRLAESALCGGAR